MTCLFVPVFVPQESPRIDTAYKDLKTTKNLENYIQWFNRLSYMVATEVCMVSPWWAEVCAKSSTCSAAGEHGYFF